MRILSYLNKHKEWMFSGIGGVILLIIATIVLQHCYSSKPPTAQATATATPPLSTVTADSIMKEVNAARPLQRGSIAKAYVGVPVSWDLLFVDQIGSDPKHPMLYLVTPNEPAGMPVGVFCDVTPS